MIGSYTPQHRYGKLWPRPDQRFQSADTSGLAIKPEVDPRPKMPSVFNQGQLGSCTANATAGAFQYDSILDGHDCGELSRLWIYYFERALEGSLGQGDTGAIGHDAFRVARRGIPDETLWPYVESQYDVQPPAAFPRAYKLTKAVHSPAQTTSEIKQVLSNDQTIAFGFTVFESFESQQVADSGVVPVPDTQNEQVLGGHEVLAVGYLEAQPDYALCRNSWGSGWGLGGYFLMPWRYFLDAQLVSDFRTVVRPA